MVITGRKVLVVTSAAFGLIIAVNVTMAIQAVRTFPGLEAANSYVASQVFDAERRAQQALGWTAQAAARDGELWLTLAGRDGQPVQPAALVVTVGRATERSDDVTPELAFDGLAWSAPLVLEPGYWNLWLEARSQEGTQFRQRLQLYVR